MTVYLTYFFQLLLVIHVLKTGRNRYWIWLLIFLPLIGGVAYFAVEILPEYMGGISGQRILRKAQGVIDPGNDIRSAERAYEQSTNPENARHYCEALLSRQRFSEAENIVRQQLRGMYAHDPLLLQLLARSQFSQDQFGQCVATLEEMNEHNPGYSSATGHLLYSRALEKIGKLDEALESYQAVSQYFPGAEACLRYCLALLTAGQKELAQSELEALLRDAKLAPNHYRHSQRKWLGRARRSLREMKSQS